MAVSDVNIIHPPLLLSIVKRLISQRGLVFAVHTTEGRSRHARISFEDERLYLHCLLDQRRQTRRSLPRGAVTLQVDEVAAAAPPCQVFLLLGWPGSAPRRVLICLSPDTPYGRQFLLLCTGQRGPCYNGTKLFMVMEEGEPGESVWGGDYEENNGAGGAALLPDLDKGEYGKSCMAGDVGLGWYDPALGCGAQFLIITKDQPGRSLPGVFGKVVGGLEVVAEAAGHRPITEVTVVDCGVVVD
ncbi:NK-tumor recognition protein [Chionoecetes opilio]|uniref:NK-tumor recognition protein n=1 Tax=Chionoecetes opilio TaxID=41210 RepID=A0A8J8WME6_CHIOP|nr:NK-tumor recognition protein [Chionoecetes opilio]